MIYYLLSLFAFVGCYNAPNAKFENSQQIENQTTSSIQDDTLRNIDVIYRSIDKGRTWSPFANGIPGNATVSGFATKANKIYAITDFNGVFVSKNGFDKWKSINNGLPDKIDINTIAVIDNVLVIGTFKQGIFLSSDEGSKWRPSNSGLQNIPVRCLIEVKDKLLAGTDKGIYVSTDKGDSWKHLFGSMQINGFTYLNEKIYAGVVDGAIMTNDDGKNWVYIYKPNTLHDISNDGKFIYAMTLEKGLLKTNNDGLTWENAYNGLPSLYTFEVRNMNNDLFAAQWYGIYYSTNRGSNWAKLNTGFNGLPDSTAFTTLEVTDFGILTGIGLRK